MSAGTGLVARGAAHALALDLTSLAPMETAARSERLREQLEHEDCPAAVISDLINVRYLTGFTGSAALLLVLPDGLVLVTDGRYALQARAELARAGVGAHVEVRRADLQLELLKKLTSGLARLGLEAEDVSWARQRRWAESWGGAIDLVPTSGLVESLRLCKDPGEVARVAAAAAVADAALACVAPMFGQRPTEAEVALALDTEMRRLGAEGPSFETIVGAGPNAAEPHHRPSSRRLAEGDLVVVDFGARVDGYCSDMTRTLVVGGAEHVPAELRRAAAVALAAQDAGLSAVRDGAGGAEVDRACREVVEAAGLGELFMHGTGHGVGLQVHEAPWLGLTSEDIICSGQVVTVEPGVYIPGLGGARTEDTVFVTDAGCQVLTLAPKDAQASL